jgi:hypothetical protein
MIAQPGGPSHGRRDVIDELGIALGATVLIWNYQFEWC